MHSTGMELEKHCSMRVKGESREKCTKSTDGKHDNVFHKWSRVRYRMALYITVNVAKHISLKK